MLRSAKPVAGGRRVCWRETIRHATYAWKFGGHYFGGPLEGPRWKNGGGAFFLIGPHRRQEGGKDPVARERGSGPLTPSPDPPSSAALLTVREPDEFLCFTERLEDLVCFWEEAATAGVGPDNYSFSYKLE